MKRMISIGLGALTLFIGCERRVPGETTSQARGDASRVTEVSGAPLSGGRDAGVTEVTGAALSGGGDAAVSANTPGQPERPATGSAATAATPYDGELQLRVPGKANESLSYAFKGDKVRLGLPSAKGKGVDAIVDVGDRRVTVLMNDRKEFVELDVDELARAAQERLADVSMERTGRTDIVYGRSCEEWLVRDRDFQVTTCVTRGGPLFDLAALEQRIGFDAPQWLAKIVSEGYVPLRVTLRDASGQPIAKSELVDVQQKVDENTFSVPEGYRKVNVSKLPAAPTPKQ